MSNEYYFFNFFGFDHDKVNARLRLFELSEKDKLTATTLHDLVILPNLKIIIDEFYEYLFSHAEYKQFLSSTDILDKLKQTQAMYLKSFGKDFDQIAYFDLRLRIGVAHQRIEMPLSLYECAYQKLRKIIFKYIPNTIEREIFNELTDFALKIISLDMSITIDSYHNHEMMVLKKSISHLEKKSHKLRELTHIDPLTGVANRSYLIQQLTDDIEKLSEKDRLCLIMIDIDNLGNINDTLGHLAGDYVIKEIINRLTSVSQHVMLGRYGGDEFMMIAYNANLEDAKTIINKNRRLVEKKEIILGKKPFNVSITQAVVQISAGDSLSAAIQQVGRELTENKRQKLSKHKKGTSD